MILIKHLFDYDSEYLKRVELWFTEVASVNTKEEAEKLLPAGSWRIRNPKAEKDGPFTIDVDVSYMPHDNESLLKATVRSKNMDSVYEYFRGWKKGLPRLWFISQAELKALIEETSKGEGSAYIENLILRKRKVKR